MSEYTTHWVRRPAFDDNGTRTRTSTTLGEAQLIMKMAFVIEPGFQAIGITDSSGRHHRYELSDPRVSEQEYLNHGFGDYDDWITRTTNDAVGSSSGERDRDDPAELQPTVGQIGLRPSQLQRP